MMGRRILPWRLRIRWQRTPFAAAAAGLIATLVVVSAFFVPAQGPAWFLGRGYLFASTAALMAWGVPAVLASDPSGGWRDFVVTVASFLLLGCVAAPPLFWAERLGESAARSASVSALVLVAVGAFLGTAVVHGVPRPRTYGQGILALVVMLAGAWGVLTT
jgi:hypothetical protein